MKSDPAYKADLPQGNRQFYLAGLSGQIVSLSLELTDDLAATCIAYMRSTERKDKCVIEWIANYKTSEGHKFYAKASEDPDYSAQAVGLDPISVSSQDKDALKKRFSNIKQMRDLFWNWYNGYKHGQYATPVVLTVTRASQQVQEWGLYLIPKKFRRDSSLKKVHTEDKFIDTVNNVDQFRALASESVNLWLEMRNRQGQSPQHDGSIPLTETNHPRIMHAWYVTSFTQI